MLNELLALTLVPSIIYPEYLHPNGSNNDMTFNNLNLTSNKSSTDFSSEILDDFFIGRKTLKKEESISTTLNNDPLLVSINKEIQRLKLELPDEDLEHLEDQSEEVRKLIYSRQQALLPQEDLRKPYNHEAELAARAAARIGRSLDGQEVNTTQFPIMVTEENENQSSLSTSSTTTQKTVTGSPFPMVNTDAASFIETIKKPFTGIAGFFKKKTTTTTTTTTSTPKFREELIVTEYTTVISTPSESVNCIGTQTEYNGVCYNVLQQLPCDKGQWLVEDEKTRKGKCIENPCHDKPQTAYFGEKCIKVSSEKDNVCHKGMRTYIYKSGIVECDCKPGHLYNERDGNCYPAYNQGPCGTSQHFIIPKRKKGEKLNSKAMCMPNPCLSDGYFCNAPSCPRQRNCALLGSNCGIENKGKFVISIETNSPTCDVALKRLPESVIGNVPTLQCAPGSRRDILGNCRTPTEISFS